MKKRITALCLALLAAVSVLLPAATAQATGPLPIPTATLTSVKFWPVSVNTTMPPVCVAVGATPAELPIAASAQLWNLATGHVLRLDAEGNCVTAGYPPSRRMTIDTYSAADGKCVKFANVSPYPTYFTYNDSFTNWTNNPIGFVNTYYASCTGTSLLKQKYAAIAIGFLLGARILSGPSWDGRGMSTTSQLYGPSANTDGHDVANLYLDFYEGIY